MTVFEEKAEAGGVLYTKTARAKGIKNGDRIRVQSPFGEVIGKASVIEEIHPQVIGMSNGISRWANHPVEKKTNTHFNRLLPADVKWTDGMTGHLETSTQPQPENNTEPSVYYLE